MSTTNLIAKYTLLKTNMYTDKSDTRIDQYFRFLSSGNTG